LQEKIVPHFDSIFFFFIVSSSGTTPTSKDKEAKSPAVSKLKEDVKLKAKKTVDKPAVCCEMSEKNFWITVGIFAVIWGISVQVGRGTHQRQSPTLTSFNLCFFKYPFMIEHNIEIPGVIHSDAYSKLVRSPRLGRRRRL
jgi:hypothetical protein